MSLNRTIQRQNLPAEINAEINTVPQTSLSALHVSLETKAITTDYLAVIFEHWWGQLFPLQGSLLLDREGKLLHSNPRARELCRAIRSREDGQQGRIPTHEGGILEIPRSIRTLAELLIKSLAVSPHQKFQLHEEIFSEEALQIYLKAEWIELDGLRPKCILITLEDLTQVAHQRALCDAYRYQLTIRETEVWELYLQGLSYRQIGNQLFIALSTVKRHMKHIYRKRRA